MTDYYALLGVSPEATPEEITAAYRRMVQLTAPNTATSAPTQMRNSIHQAYSVLSDVELRNAYDEELTASHLGLPVRKSFLPAFVPAPRFSPEGAWYYKHVDKEARVSPMLFPSWVLWASVALMLGFAGVLVALWTQEWMAALAWGVYGAASALFLKFYPMERNGNSRLVSYGVIVLVATVAFSVVFGYDHAVLSALAGIGAGTFAYVLRARDIASGKAANVLLSVKAIRENFDLGTPGGSTLRAAQLGRASSVDLPERIHAQQTTAAVLERLDVIPGVRVIHGVQLGTYVDHVVVCGDRVALIESGLRPPGQYEMNARGEVIVDGGTRPSIHTNLGASVARAVSSLGAAKAKAWMVLHPASEGEMVVKHGEHARGKVHLVDAHGLLNEVGTFLAEGSWATTINSTVINEVWARKMDE